EVIAVDVDGLAFLEGPQRLFGLPGQVGEDADDEGELDLLHGAAGLDVVGDLHPRAAHPIQLVLQTLRHVSPPLTGEVFGSRYPLRGEALTTRPVERLDRSPNPCAELRLVHSLDL